MTKRSKAKDELPEGDPAPPSAAEVDEHVEPSEERPPAPGPDIERVQRELEDARSRAEELSTRFVYLQAELENQRKRAEREVEQAIRFANEGLVAQLLPLLDDLDAAVAAVPGDTGKGFAMLRDSVLRVLAGAGLEEIPAAGTTFDPFLHECVQQVGDGSLPDGTVRDVVRKGYRYRMKVMRPAQVVVVNNGGETSA